jgi:galactokinase/mevalonate kinase-like predicted kinase
VLREFSGELIHDLDLAAQYSALRVQASGPSFAKHEAYTSAAGGVNDQGYEGEAVHDDDLVLKESVRLTFEQNCLLFSADLQGLGDTAPSHYVEKIQNGGKEIEQALHRSKTTAQALRNVLLAGDLRRLDVLFEEEWEAQQALYPKECIEALSRFIHLGRNAGATAAKPTGWGSPYLLFYCEELEARQKTLEALTAAGCTSLPFQIDDVGVRVWTQPQIHS